MVCSLKVKVQQYTLFCCGVRETLVSIHGWAYLLWIPLRVHAHMRVLGVTGLYIQNAGFVDTPHFVDVAAPVLVASLAPIAGCIANQSKDNVFSTFRCRESEKVWRCTPCMTQSRIWLTHTRKSRHPFFYSNLF
jgi:hypothetical protein